MLRSFLMCVALVGLVAMADQAEARGRRGGCSGGRCSSGGYSSGYSGGGCYGGSCGVSSGGCQSGQCQVSTTPVRSAPVVKTKVAPAVPGAIVNSGYNTTPRYTGWRSGGRRFR